jgi:hypothetical protein
VGAKERWKESAAEKKSARRHWKVSENKSTTKRWREFKVWRRKQGRKKICDKKGKTEIERARKEKNARIEQQRWPHGPQRDMRSIGRIQKYCECVLCNLERVCESEKTKKERQGEKEIATMREKIERKRERGRAKDLLIRRKTWSFKDLGLPSHSAVQTRAGPLRTHGLCPLTYGRPCYSAN